MIYCYNKICFKQLSLPIMIKPFNQCVIKLYVLYNIKQRHTTNSE